MALKKRFWKGSETWNNVNSRLPKNNVGFTDQGPKEVVHHVLGDNFVVKNAQWGPRYTWLELPGSLYLFVTFLTSQILHPKLETPLCRDQTSPCNSPIIIIKALRLAKLDDWGKPHWKLVGITSLPISFSIQMYGLGPSSTNVEVWDIDVEKAQQLEPEGWSRAVVPSIDSWGCSVTSISMEFEWSRHINRNCLM